MHTHMHTHIFTHTSRVLVSRQTHMRPPLIHINPCGPPSRISLNKGRQLAGKGVCVYACTRARV
jgi:hypothetical protein